MKKIKIISSILVIFMIYVLQTQNYVFAYKKSSSEIVIDVNSGRVLYQYEADKSLPMASTTKIVTCITAIENYDLDSVITIKKNTCNVEGSSVYLKEGEKYTLKSLLYGLMLRSGNDAAETIADFCGGRENFIFLMNKFAKKCGALSSNFTNPHGLHEENHYTTARDLGKITAYSMKNLEFSQIVSCKKTDVTELSSNIKKTYINKNKILNLFEGGIGVKTGYTKKAGRCLVSASERSGLKIVCVVLNSQDMFNRSMEVMENCFYNYKAKTLIKKEVFNLNCSVCEAENSTFGLQILNDVVLPLKENENCYFEVVMPQEYISVIKKGEEIGKINIFIENELIFSEKIYTIETVDNSDYYDLLKNIAENFIG